MFIFFDSTVGSHRISNEVRRNKFLALAALLFDIMARTEYSFKLLLSILDLKIYVYTQMMQDVAFENRYPGQRGGHL